MEVTGSQGVGFESPQLNVKPLLHRPASTETYLDRVTSLRKLIGRYDIEITDLDRRIHSRLADHVGNTFKRRGRENQESLDGCFVEVGLTRAFAVSSYKGAWRWLQINKIFPADDPTWIRE